MPDSCTSFCASWICTTSLASSQGYSFRFGQGWWVCSLLRRNDQQQWRSHVLVTSLWVVSWGPNVWHTLDITCRVKPDCNATTKPRSSLRLHHTSYIHQFSYICHTSYSYVMITNPSSPSAPCRWNIHDMDANSPRTNNNVEGWHNKLPEKLIQMYMSWLKFSNRNKPTQSFSLLSWL